MTPSAHPNVRTVENEVHRDLPVADSYGGYLRLPQLLDSQKCVSDPPHHDELLFIIQHQTSELWFKLVLHELSSVAAHLDSDDLDRAMKGLARVKHVLRTLTEQWSVLATMTPSEYAEFRPSLGSASGFQSHQYRAVEFLLGNKNAEMLAVFAQDPAATRVLTELLDSPSLYDRFLHLLARRGHPVPAAVLERDVRAAHQYVDELVPILDAVYADPGAQWEVYEACEELVDLEDAFQLWRFRHLKTVERMIGARRGTGGSSGVPFLRAALDLTFFPELYAVRGTARS